MEAKKVSEHFDFFLKCYSKFKHEYGLKETLDNSFEMTTAMADKLGRICREVKHLKRNDPRHNYKVTLSQEISGLIVYAIMIANKYSISIPEGMTEELEKAIDQHSEN